MNIYDLKLLIIIVVKLAWYKLNGSPLAVEVHIVLRKFAFDDRMFASKAIGQSRLGLLV